ncbi:TPR repeat protein [Elusimicrobium posterum]|uniref:tetratricopeptide repeat protein n=1 Tax=Elusimicrobium posterum TaxID=3116653 RepID=UPI003C733D14
MKKLSILFILIFTPFVLSAQDGAPGPGELCMAFYQNFLYKEAHENCQAGAKAGDSWSYVVLGNMYGRGLGVDKDLTKSAEFYKKAADKKNTTGMFNLATAYVNGDGVKQNSKTAIKLYKKAAKGGNYEGYYMIGKIYDEGKGVKQDLKKALEYYTMAAEKENYNGAAALTRHYSQSNELSDMDKVWFWGNKARNIKLKENGVAAE